ncbi:MAG: hypothetical protein R6V15_02105 [Desulfotignum sp.]
MGFVFHQCDFIPQPDPIPQQERQVKQNAGLHSICKKLFSSSQNTQFGTKTTGAFDFVTLHYKTLGLPVIFLNRAFFLQSFRWFWFCHYRENWIKTGHLTAALQLPIPSPAILHAPAGHY